MVSEIYVNIEMVFYLKKIHLDLETRERKLNFKKRSVPIFPTSEMVVKLKKEETHVSRRTFP